MKVKISDICIFKKEFTDFNFNKDKLKISQKLCFTAG